MKRKVKKAKKEEKNNLTPEQLAGIIGGGVATAGLLGTGGYFLKKKWLNKQKKDRDKNITGSYIDQLDDIQKETMGVIDGGTMTDFTVQEKRNTPVSVFGKIKKDKVKELEKEIERLKRSPKISAMSILVIVLNVLLIIHLSLYIPQQIKSYNKFGNSKRNKLKKIITELMKDGMKPNEIISITLSVLIKKLPKKESKALGKILWKDALKRSSFGKTKTPEEDFKKNLVKGVSKQILNKKTRGYWIGMLKTMWYHSEHDKPRGLFDFIKHSYKKSRRKQFGKKKIKRNSIMKKEKISSTLKKMCKKHKVRLTVKRNGKRVYKSVKVLKKQCANKKKKKSKRKFGAARRMGYVRPAPYSFGNVEPFYGYTVGSPVRFGSRRPHKHPLRYAFYNPAKTDKIFRK